MSLPLWWLSFADPGRPSGEQFLGVCLVNAADMVSAIRVAHALGINPGGQVAGVKVDPRAQTRLSFSLDPYLDRRIYPDEARELDRRINQELAS